MKMMRINSLGTVLVCIICLFGFFSCSLKKNGAKGDKKEANFSFYIKKGACYGKCPTYELTINTDGSMVFVGERFVEKEGRHTKSISIEEVNKLGNTFKDAGFFTMEDTYDGNVTDLPTVIIQCSEGETTKRIKSRFDSPEKLDELQKKLEAIAESDGWTKATE